MYFTGSIPPYMKAVLINSVAECRDLPQASPIYDQEQPAHSVGGLTADGSAILWLGMAFESVSYVYNTCPKKVYSAHKVFKFSILFLLNSVDSDQLASGDQGPYRFSSR